MAPVVTTTSIFLNSNKIQNGDILVPAYLGVPGKWPLNKSCHRHHWWSVNATVTHRACYITAVQAIYLFHHATNSLTAMKTAADTGVLVDLNILQTVLADWCDPQLSTTWLAIMRQVRQVNSCHLLRILWTVRSMCSLQNYTELTMLTSLGELHCQEMSTETHSFTLPRHTTTYYRCWSKILLRRLGNMLLAKF